MRSVDGADALDPGAHLGQAFGNVADLGLARGVLDHRLALGERGRHHDVVRGADRHLGERDARAAQALGRLGDHVAAVDVDLGAQRLHAHQVQVDGPRADGAAAGHGNARLAAARQQRPEHPEARPHAAHQLIGRGGVDDIARGEMHGLAQVGRGIRALAVDGEIEPMVAQDAREQIDVGQVRDVLEREPVGREQAGDDQRQGGILRARDRNGAVEAAAAGDADAIHVRPRLEFALLGTHDTRHPLPDPFHPALRPPLLVASLGYGCRIVGFCVFASLLLALLEVGAQLCRQPRSDAGLLGPLFRSFSCPPSGCRACRHLTCVAERVQDRAGRRRSRRLRRRPQPPPPELPRPAR